MDRAQERRAHASAQLNGSADNFRSVALSPLGTYIAFASNEGLDIFRDWTTALEKPIHVGVDASAIRFSPDETFIAAASMGNVSIFRTIAATEGLAALTREIARSVSHLICDDRSAAHPRC